MAVGEKKKKRANKIQARASLFKGVFLINSKLISKFLLTTSKYRKIKGAIQMNEI